MNKAELRRMIKEELDSFNEANPNEDRAEVQISVKGKGKVLKTKQFDSFKDALAWIKTQGANRGKVEYNVYSIEE